LSLPSVDLNDISIENKEQGGDAATTKEENKKGIPRRK
jgi:hypothetical protein